MDVYEESKRWPREEMYSLTDQVRRSSRSVCANLREGWARRRYIAHFLSKLADADAENGETQTWLDFARDCGHLGADRHDDLKSSSESVGRMLGAMLKNPTPFLITDQQ